jgi:hypothetical protein
MLRRSTMIRQYNTMQLARLPSTKATAPLTRCGIDLIAGAMPAHCQSRTSLRPWSPQHE